MAETMAVDAPGGDLPGPPAHLLEQTFFAPETAQGLLAPGMWNPYPRATDRAGWNALPQSLRGTLVRRADTANTGDWPQLLATTAMQFKRTGSRAEYESTQFARRVRLVTLVLGECATAEGKYLDQIANGLWLTCEESFWGATAHLGAQKAGVGLPDTAEPFVDLFAAETAATMGWIVYLLEQELTSFSPLLVPRVRREAKRRVLDPALARDDFWWMGLGGKPRPLNNWTPWIDSNWLTASLLLEQDPALRGQAVAKICRSADRFLADYSPDGACEEGPNYWQRSAASFFDCCWTLVSAHNGAGKPVLQHPFLKAMGGYIVSAHIAGNQYVNYGDAHVNATPAPDVMYRFGKADGDPVLSGFGALEAATRGTAGPSSVLDTALEQVSGLGSLSRALAAVMCTAEMAAVPRHQALLRDAWYPKLQFMAARLREGSSDGFYIAMQAANNGRPHGHNDSGSFLVYHDGAPIFIDVGVAAYEAKTFSAERYTIWTMQSAFHNLPTINGVMQHDGRAYQATGLAYATSDTSASVRVDLAPAYPTQAGVRQWKRELTLDRSRNAVHLREEFVLEKESPVMLSLMTPRLPTLQHGGILLHIDGKSNVLLTYDPDNLNASVEKIPLTDASLKHSWGENIYRIQLTSARAIAKADWSLHLSTA
jgi:hypothetical protein